MKRGLVSNRVGGSDNRGVNPRAEISLYDQGLAGDVCGYWEVFFGNQSWDEDEDVMED